MIRPGDERALRQYTTGLYAGLSEDLARKLVELGDGSVWRYRPPSSPEWPEGYWSYAAGAPELTRDDVEAWISTKYIGDWAPDRVQWTIERIGGPGRAPNPRKRDERAAARRYVRGLSRGQLFELGDQLVLGTFDWTEWFEKKPSAAFMRALDDERLYAEDREPNPKGRSRTKKGVNWPAPRMTVVANRGKGKIRRPKLTDATKMAKEYPRTFDLPSKKAVKDLGIGDFAKVSADGERFWVRVTGRKGKKIEGVVDNDVVLGQRHGLALGDKISFETKNLFDAVSNERMTRAHADVLAANPYGSKPPRRRSDKVRKLEKLLRRYKGNLKDLEYILDHGKPSSEERAQVEFDQGVLERRIGEVERELDLLESQIEYEGDFIGERPPMPSWGIPRKRNEEDAWIQEEGSLGEGFLTEMSFAEQKQALRRALDREKKERGGYKAAYRSTLGKVMVLNRSGALREKYGPKIDRIRDWFVAEYGADSRHWPTRGKR